MPRFYLNTNDPIKGKFLLKKINLAFVFQVNCPGCFIYGIPLVNQLFEKYSGYVSFIGVSTAFEDFELNTEANTRLLIQDGTVVGETKKYLNDQNQDKYNTGILFPVAFDRLKPAEEFLTEENLTAICNTNPDFSFWPQREQQAVMQNVKDFYKQHPILAETFVLNQLKGTPSFVFFDENYNILKSLFGHQSIETLESHLPDHFDH